MAFWLKKRLSYDICEKINKINYKYNIDIIKLNKLLCHEELIDKYKDIYNIYSSHEYYFVQLLPFTRKMSIRRPKLNNNLDYMFYNISHIDHFINYCHHLIYKDHLNINIYQKQIYNIYYPIFNL